MGKLTVTDHDGLGRYLVESEAGKPPYLVDLLAWDGEGECTCQHWQYRIGSALRNELPPPIRFCKHIEAARDTLLDSVISKMISMSAAGSSGV